MNRVFLRLSGLLLLFCFNAVLVFAQGRPAGGGKTELVELRIRTLSIDETLGEKKLACRIPESEFQNLALPEKNNTLSASHLGI
jgi:hypothetical protein